MFISHRRSTGRRNCRVSRWLCFATFTDSSTVRALQIFGYMLHVNPCTTIWCPQKCPIAKYNRPWSSSLKVSRWFLELAGPSLSCSNPSSWWLMVMPECFYEPKFTSATSVPLHQAPSQINKYKTLQLMDLFSIKSIKIHRKELVKTPLLSIFHINEEKQQKTEHHFSYQGGKRKVICQAQKKETVPPAEP